ncbi:MAG TPA: 4-hydroxy-tetrahydrodipicolinate synthase [Parachlamydiaceae bacterium]|nr:4-hydroxy-tetrahydrodipicolinate synthase [Parachlamydiaceae bacterium]
MLKMQGTHTALVTPFHEGGSLNENALREMILFQLKNGVDGIVALGTTGEAPTLKDFEKKRIIEIAVEERNAFDPEKRILVSVGTGCYSTEQTIENTLLAKNLGADVALVVTPYYNKPTQEGLFQHFKAVAEKTDFPILVYNIAGRTGQNMETSTLKRLSEIPSIIGVKEASGNVLQMMDVYSQIAEERKDFCLLSGDDALTMPLMCMGGHGVISVVSNLVPDLIKALTHYLQNGQVEEARKLHYALLPLFKAAFVETNPIPIKAAMNDWGMRAGPCRLPLCPLSKENEEKLKFALSCYESCIHG